MVPFNRLRLKVLTVFGYFSCLATSKKSDAEITDLMRLLLSPLHLVTAGEKSLSTNIYIFTLVARNISICLFLISDFIKNDWERLSLAKVAKASTAVGLCAIEVWYMCEPSSMQEKSSNGAIVFK